LSFHDDPEAEGVQIRTRQQHRNKVECRMPIDPDNDAERQARVDGMINEFREAQSRRFGKPTDKSVESKPDEKTVESKPETDTNGPVTGSVISQ
jgi:hypothetical protein